MQFLICGQYQPWLYLALFSHNTTVTHRRTNGQQTHCACQRLQHCCSASKRSLLLGDKVPFYRPYMARWCI